MSWNRRAGCAAALTLALAAGCLNDVSNLAPYASRIGTTYRLTADCELWPPKAPGADYTILPFIPQLVAKKKKGVPLAEGAAVRVEAVRRGEHDSDYLIVTLDDPAKAGHRIRASALPECLEGWEGAGTANRPAVETAAADTAD
jgi:hypothetical protein